MQKFEPQHLRIRNNKNEHIKVNLANKEVLKANKYKREFYQYLRYNI